MLTRDISNEAKFNNVNNLRTKRDRVAWSNSKSEKHVIRNATFSDSELDTSESLLSSQEI